MPLIFTISEATESGHRYSDVPFRTHEFPRKYQNLVKPGERFIYYRGRRGATDGRPSYFGAGLVGDVHEKSSNLFECEVVGAEPFEAPVYFKDENGKYLETHDHSNYWRDGVRVVSEETFERILFLADFAFNEPSDAPALDLRRAGIYADPQTARRVELYSRQVVVASLTTEFPSLEIQEMPFNNPGFDILTNVGGRRFVEVKGTQAGFPRFLMSERERRHWEIHYHDYSVYTVYGINLDMQSHSGVRRFEGHPSEAIQLQPMQWLGEGTDADGEELLA